MKEKIKKENKNTQRNRIFIGIILILLIIMVCIVKYAYDKEKSNQTYRENNYNLAFSELVYYVQNIENLLAKATISSSNKNGIETLTEIYRDSDLAVAYLSQVPLSTKELTKTAKFLNQLSEYSYSLSKKAINHTELTQEDLDNIKMLHEYSIDLKNSLSQMEDDISNEVISWKDITKTNIDDDYIQEVDNISLSTLVDIDKNFSEYSGLIYDGAFSEHIEKREKKGLSGDEISKEEAEKKVKEVFAKSKIKKINYLEEVKDANIPVYKFSVEMYDTNVQASISITKKAGKVLLMSYPKKISQSRIEKEDADRIGKEFLAKIGFDNMKETYYQLDDNTITVNYAYNQNNVVVYPDLIKVKMSLYDGEILGIESKGYINCHYQRKDIKAKINKEEAKKNLNKKLNIQSEGLAIIPTEWKSEILCYEFKGKVDETEFLVYINAETGEEEEILVIIETEGGVLTM
ncbi:MAG: germination protein YpeB [Clostridia bacterium]|nr:germination protein YpeB [Clostridia bacterium]